MASQSEQFQDAFRQYSERFGPGGTREVCQWAVTNRILSLPTVDPLSVMADRMAQALREEMATDPKTGRRYRKNHATKIMKHGVQTTMWATLDTGPYEHMQMSFRQRREQIVGDCIQLKNDVDVFNGRNQDRPIQLILDFTNDVHEAEAADGIAPAA